MAGRRANKRPEESSSSEEPEWRISGRQHMVESHGLTVTRTRRTSTIAMTATAMAAAFACSARTPDSHRKLAMLLSVLLSVLYALLAGFCFRSACQSTFAVMV